MRSAFVKAITELARKDEDITVVIGDTGFSVFEEFEKEFGERFINVGIAEQNMVGFAAGLAMQGRKVFAYNVVSFMTLRALEQIQLDISYQENPVVLIGVGGGYNYGTAGPTHHATQDIGIMRTIPNMTVICPGDPLEMEEATKQAIELGTPCYIRICRSVDPVIHTNLPEFKIGKAIKMKEGKDAVIFATGGMLKDAVKVVDKLSENGLEVRLYSMHTIKPLDDELILNILEEGIPIFSMEEHSIYGGLASAISEVIAKSAKMKNIFKAYAFPDMFVPNVGTRDALHKQFGVDAESIIEDIKKLYYNGI